jgi:hypothetical protein
MQFERWQLKNSAHLTLTANNVYGSQLERCALIALFLGPGYRGRAQKVVGPPHVQGFSVKVTQNALNPNISSHCW